MDRLVQRRDEHGAAQTQLFGTGGGVRHRLERADRRSRAEYPLLRPPALEPERLCSSEVGAKAGGVERAVLDELGNRDRPAHTATLSLDTTAG